MPPNWKDTIFLPPKKYTTSPTAESISNYVGLVLASRRLYGESIYLFGAIYERLVSKPFSSVTSLTLNLESSMIYYQSWTAPMAFGQIEDGAYYLTPSPSQQKEQPTSFVDV